MLSKARHVFLPLEEQKLSQSFKLFRLLSGHHKAITRVPMAIRVTIPKKIWVITIVCVCSFGVQAKGG